MFDAVKQDRADVLKTFSHHELNDAVDELGNTVLHVACEKGSLEVIKYLSSIAPIYDFDRHLAKRNYKHYSPMNKALIESQIVVLDWLFTNFKDQAQEELSYSQLGTPTLLSMAVMLSDMHVMNLLIDHMEMHCITIDEPNINLQTSLHMAAHHGKLESCQVLINRGANALLRDCNGFTAAQVAEQREHAQVASYLIVVETCIRLANQVVTLRENLQRSHERNEALQSLLQKRTTSSYETKLHYERSIPGGSHGYGSHTGSGDKMLTRRNQTTVSYVASKNSSCSSGVTDRDFQICVPESSLATPMPTAMPPIVNLDSQKSIEFERLKDIICVPEFTKEAMRSYPDDSIVKRQSDGSGVSVNRSIDLTNYGKVKHNSSVISDPLVYRSKFDRSMEQISHKLFNASIM